MHEIQIWKPYRWRSFPDLEVLEEGGNIYSFLSPHRHHDLKKRKNHTKRSSDTTTRTEIYIGKDDDEIISKTLPFVCDRLWRDRSSFFQMLYMYYLRELDLLDEEFILRPDFEKRIRQIKNWKLGS